MKNLKMNSAWLLAVLAVSFIGACGGGSSPAVARPEAVKPIKPAEPKTDAEPVKTPAQPEAKVEDVKVEHPAQPAGDAKADKSDVQSEQKTADASQEPVPPPVGTPLRGEERSPFYQPETVFIVNVSKPVTVESKEPPAEPIVEEAKVEAIKVEDAHTEPALEVPEAKATEVKFKLVDRDVGYTFVKTDKKKLGLDELDLQDDELYVRCETAGHKPVHMLATVEYMKGLQARDNLRPTATGFHWTQDSLEFDCVVYGKKK